MLNTSPSMSKAWSSVQGVHGHVHGELNASSEIVRSQLPNDELTVNVGRLNF